MGAERVPAWGVGPADAAPLVFDNLWPKARFLESLAEGALTFCSEIHGSPGSFAFC